MALSSSSCVSHSQISLKNYCRGLAVRQLCKISSDQWMMHSVQGLETQRLDLYFPRVGAKLRENWSFLGGHRFSLSQELGKVTQLNKSPAVSCSWFTGPQIASSVFTLGTAAVLPFYTLMVVAPKSEITKKAMESSLPYVVLGLLYAYLLYLSWTPDTIRLMFASNYWLPELSGIAKMFSSDTTLASAWIHLLVVDLFAARQVYRDGLENDIETRHSVSLCLLFCPVGILTHAITKALTRRKVGTKHTVSKHSAD